MQQTFWKASASGLANSPMKSAPSTPSNKSCTTASHYNLATNCGLLKGSTLPVRGHHVHQQEGDLVAEVRLASASRSLGPSPVMCIACKISSS